MLRHHSAATLFPPMTEQQYRAHVEDIRRNGLVTRILLIIENGEKLILDGVHRERACRELGIELTEKDFEIYEGDDPLGRAASLNKNRRHMTPSSLARVGVELEKRFAIEAKKRMLRGKGSGGLGPHPKAELPQGLNGKTKTRTFQARDQAATILGISGRHITKAKRIAVQGSLEVNDAVDEGIVTVDDAERIVTLPHERQVELVAKVREGKAKTLFQASEGTPSRKAKYQEKCERVRHLFENEGLTQSQIVEQTGWAASFVYGILPSKKKGRGALHAVIADANSTHVAWSTRAEQLPHSWVNASKNEKEELIEALRKCRTAASQLINRFKHSME